jgi:hypothetical protein
LAENENMDVVISIGWMALLALIYVVIPLATIWLIARGGHATRVITFIASVIVVAIIATGTGFSSQEHSARAAFENQFSRPFHDLSEHLHDLLIKGQVEQATALSERMMKLELRFSTRSNETNTLHDFVHPIIKNEDCQQGVHLTASPDGSRR